MTYTPKHSQKKYTTWINNEIVLHTPMLSPKLIIKKYITSLLANRDVLERHEGKSDETESWCVECGEFKYYFPCPTYLDIAQRLDEVM